MRSSTLGTVGDAGPDRPPCAASFIDCDFSGNSCSDDGGGLYISGAADNPPRFDNCAITIPKLLEIHSEAVVRHYHENKHSQTLVCGMELTKMHVTDRRRLEHFIQTIAKSAESA